LRNLHSFPTRRSSDLIFLKDNKLEMHYLRVVDDEMEKDFEEILQVFSNQKPETPNQKPETPNHKAQTTLQPFPRISKPQYLDKVDRKSTRLNSSHVKI